MSEYKLTENDKAEIGNDIAEGFTSGIIDQEEDGKNYRISWNLTFEKFEN